MSFSDSIIIRLNWQNYFKHFDWQKILSIIIDKLFLIILFTIVFVIFQRVGKAIIIHLFKRYGEKYGTQLTDKRIKTFRTLSTNIYSYCVWFFWIYSILSTLGVPVGTLIASAGVFSLAIGLGAQGFVTDIVSGFFIILEKQIQVGEYVSIGDIKGTVQAVGLRTTQLVSDDGTLNFIPNRSISVISNLSRNNMVAIIKIGILPDTPIEKAISIITDVNEHEVPNHADIVVAPKIIGAVTLPDGKLAIQVNILTKNGAQYEIQHSFLALYLEALNQNGIKLPTSPVIIK